MPTRSRSSEVFRAAGAELSHLKTINGRALISDYTRVRVKCKLASRYTVHVVEFTSPSRGPGTELDEFKNNVSGGRAECRRLIAVVVATR